MSRPSTVLSQHRKHRCVAAVLVVILSARMLAVTDGLTTTSRPSANISPPSDNRPESGDFLAMSDTDTGKGINGQNFDVARSEFADYCLNGDCVNGDVLKVVSKLAKRILSDPRILGLRTAREPVHDYDRTNAPEESAARSFRNTRSLKSRVNSKRRKRDDEGGNDQKVSKNSKGDPNSSEEESSKVLFRQDCQSCAHTVIRKVVKLDTTVNCYNAAPGGWESFDVFYPDNSYDDAYGSNPDYADGEEANTNVDTDTSGTKGKQSSAGAIGETVGFYDTNSFTDRDDFYNNNRIPQRYDQNRLATKYKNPDSYHVSAGLNPRENPKAYRVPGRVNHGGTHASSPGFDESLDSGSTKYVSKKRDDDDKGGGGSSYGGGGGYSGSYGGGSSYGYSGYDECCMNKLLPILLVGLLGLLGFFLYIRSTTLAAARSIDDNDLSDVLLDGPTWLSMVHELWEQDTPLEKTICTQETLCRMNRLAMSAPSGQAGWAVSLSSLPLSYLLHTRHLGGFTSYMDAAMMGRSGANCTELYSSCPRLSH